MQGNTRPIVYVSYSQKHDDDIKLLASLEAKLPDIEFRIDKNYIEDGDDFMSFIDELCKADYIIVTLSEAYFQSFYCMYELTKIIHDEKDFKDRVFFIRDDSYDLTITGNQKKLTAYWTDMLIHAEAEERPKPLDTKGSKDQILEVLYHLGKTLELVATIQAPEQQKDYQTSSIPNMERTGYDRIREWLRKIIPSPRLMARIPKEDDEFIQDVKLIIEDILQAQPELYEAIKSKLNLGNHDKAELAKTFCNYSDKAELLVNKLAPIFKSALKVVKNKAGEKEYNELKKEIYMMVNALGILSVDYHKCNKIFKECGHVKEVLASTDVTQTWVVGRMSGILSTPNHNESIVRGNKELQSRKPGNSTDPEDEFQRCLINIYNEVYKYDRDFEEKGTNDILTEKERNDLNVTIIVEADMDMKHYYFLARSNEYKTSILADAKLVSRLNETLPALDFFRVKDPLGNTVFLTSNENTLSIAYKRLIQYLDKDW